MCIILKVENRGVYRQEEGGDWNPSKIQEK